MSRAGGAGWGCPARRGVSFSLDGRREVLTHRAKNPRQAGHPHPATGPARLPVLVRMRGVLELPEEPGDDEGDLLADVDRVVADPLDRPRRKQHRHRPFATVGIVADLQRQAEAVAVEVVDDVVLLHQVARHLHVAFFESPLGLADQRARLAAHAEDQLHHLLVGGRLVARQRDHLADVHALVAHPLDVLQHVQQGRDQAQVGRHRRLRGEQRDQALVHLQVAAVDPVVVGDHDLRQLDVLLLDRFQRAPERRRDQVEPAEAARLELLELLLVFDPGLHQPNFPETYCSVRLVAWVGEDLVRRGDLDQLAAQHERGRVGDPRRLLHVVGDDRDRHPLLQLRDQLLDAQRRNRVERRTGLVHQQHLGVDGKRPRDAEPLLLAPREAGPRLSQAVLDLVPEAGPDQRLAHPIVELAAPGAGEAQPGGDVVVHRHGRKRVRFLEDHADDAPHRDDVHLGGVQIDVVEQHATLEARARNLLVHPVDAAHHRRLAAAGRADDRRHLTGLEGHAHALDRLVLAVEGAQPLEADRVQLGGRTRPGRGSLGRALGLRAARLRRAGGAPRRVRRRCRDR